MTANNRNFLTLIGIVGVLIIALWGSAYTVNEKQQAVIIRFGKIITQEPIMPGLHFKLPFIDNVRYLERRLLTWFDRDELEIPTRDKKNILVDTMARWRIVDPVRYIETLGSQNIAFTRLSAIIGTETRNVVANHELIEVVRNSNNILSVIEAKKQKYRELEAEVQQAIKEGKIPPTLGEEEVTGEIEPIAVGRQKLERLIFTGAKEKTKSFGIELIDVQIRSLMYQNSVQEKVYDRMISERQRAAEKIRSYGKREKQIILGKINKEKKQIEAEAYKTVQITLGEAEAKAVEIYANAIDKSPEFYKFFRQLEIYEEGFDGESQFILSDNHPLLSAMNKGLKGGL